MRLFKKGTQQGSCQSSITIGMLVIALATGHTHLADAQSEGTTYQIDKHVVSGGGQHSTSTQYAITGSIGQPVTELSTESSQYAASAGFWANHSTPPLADLIFADGFQ